MAKDKRPKQAAVKRKGTDPTDQDWHDALKTGQYRAVLRALRPTPEDLKGLSRKDIFFFHELHASPRMKLASFLFRLHDSVRVSRATSKWAGKPEGRFVEWLIQETRALEVALLKGDIEAAAASAIEASGFQTLVETDDEGVERNRNQQVKSTAVTKAQAEKNRKRVLAKYEKYVATYPEAIKKRVVAHLKKSTKLSERTIVDIIPKTRRKVTAIP